MRAFILAGGFATRLWPLTEKRAKPLLPLAGKPIVDHIVNQIPADIPVAVSTNAAFKGGFEDWMSSHTRPNLSLVIEDAHHDGQKLGALGAIAQWIETEDIDDDLLLLTGDNYFGFSMSSFLDTFQDGTPLLAAYDIKDIEQAKAFGTVILNEGTANIKAFEEKPAQPKTTLVSTGCSILPKKSHPILLQFAKENPDNVGGIFEEFLLQGLNVDCFTFTEPWFDIGSFPAYLEATRALVGENVLFGDRATKERSTLEGSVVIGDGSKVENSTLKNTVIFHNCTITNCILEDCIIDDACILKGVDITGKMIRRNTIIERS